MTINQTLLSLGIFSKQLRNAFYDIKGIIYIVNILILLILKKCYSLHNDIAIHRAKYVGRYVLTHSPNSWPFYKKGLGTSAGFMSVSCCSIVKKNYHNISIRKKYLKPLQPWNCFCSYIRFENQRMPNYHFYCRYIYRFR